MTENLPAANTTHQNSLKKTNNLKQVYKTQKINECKLTGKLVFFKEESGDSSSLKNP